MALDSATAALISSMAGSGAPPLWEMSPVNARAMGKARKAAYGVGPDMRHVDELTLSSSAGGEFHARLLVPSESPTALIVYLHGGGWVVGSVDEFDTLGRILAEKTGAAVLLVDYRKAPEYPYPVPVEDAWSALEWASSHLEEIAGEGAALIIAGDSAGGNLAAVCAQRASQRGGPALALQVLVYPVTDADFDTASYIDDENQLVLSRRAMIWFWDHYLGDIERRAEPEASPLKAVSFEGLPPAVVITAEHDPLRDEGEAYAARLAKADVEVIHRRFEGQMHGFFSMVNVLPGSAAALDFVAASVATILGKAYAR